MAPSPGSRFAPDPENVVEMPSEVRAKLEGKDHEGQARELETFARRDLTGMALSYAVAAADCYMVAFEEATDPRVRGQLARKTQDAYVFAKNVKYTHDTREKGDRRSGLRDGPQSRRELTTAEKVILLKSGKVGGCKFPPWEKDPGMNEFKMVEGGMFTDQSVYSFSAQQEEHLDGWKRPHDLFGVTREELQKSLETLPTQYDFVQDLTPDCSIVASLCSAIRYLKPSHDSLLPNIIFPYNHDKGRPMLSPNGKYIVRLNINGCFRSVVIDDRLPASKTARALTAIDRLNPHVFWQALLEKAYLKFRGGYNFPGSNTGTDLWALTGWIPEQIHLRSHAFDADSTWNRLFRRIDLGDIMVSLGTGRFEKAEEIAFGLASEHDYAVLSFHVSDDGTRRLLLKNPWCDGLVWEAAASLASLQVSEIMSVTQQADSVPADDRLTGAFWIAWDDVVHLFESLYLNWNPSIFSERQDHHFSWTLPDNVFGRTLVKNPQYSITTKQGDSIYIVLTRHYHDEPDLPKASAEGHPQGHGTYTTGDAEPSSQTPSPLGFVGVYTFHAQGQFVMLPDNPVSPVHFVDSPQTTITFDDKTGKNATLVVAQSGLPLPQYSFTLSVFSRFPVQVAKAKPQYAHQQDIQGTWTIPTSGGNASSPAFSTNPQYLLKLARPTKLAVVLSTDQEALPIQVMLAWTNGKRVSRLTNREVICSSGEYKRGYAFLDSKSLLGGVVDAGSHALIVSTYEPGQLGRFNLHIEADHPVAVTPIPADDAGKFTTQLKPVPFYNNSSGTQHTRLKCPISASRLSKATFVVRTDNKATRSPLRLSVEFGLGAHIQTLESTSDGEFADASMGLRTEEVDLQPESVLLQRWYASDAATLARGNPLHGLLWLVIEQDGSSASGSRAQVKVDVLSDQKISIGDWVAADD